MGFSRDTFYRYQSASAEGGVDALINASRKKTNLRNRVEEATEAAVTVFALEQPAFGQVQVSNERRKRGIFISPSGVHSVWLRRDLESFKKRLAALERHVAQRGEDWSSHRSRRWRRSRKTMWRMARSKRRILVIWAAAKLYMTKTPITAVDLLNNCVLPVFDEQGMSRVLNDSGTEYCGKPEAHDYQLYLALKDIEHTKTKANHPQSNGICERFHKAILNEFYQVAFRRARLCHAHPRCKHGIQFLLDRCQLS
jgi:transposase InsO family protein